MKKTVILLLALFVTTGLACSTLSDLISGDGPAPPDGLMGEGASSGDVIFSDDFADESTGWEQGEYETGTVGYESGAYSVVSFGDGDTMWGVSNRTFADVVIEVEAEQVRAPTNDNNDYGVMCRVQENNDGYFLLISGDGFYAILLRADGQFTQLVDWTLTDRFNLGNATNRITAECNGSSLSLTVNGNLLAATEDSTFSTGDIALTATSYEAQETEVQFDNLRVTKP